MKKMTQAMLLLAQIGVVGLAHGASVSLSPAVANATVGSTVQFTVNVDFTDDPTSGGGVQIAYDSNILGNAFFSYSGSLPGSILDTWAPDFSAGLIEGIGFDASSFNGSTTLGTLSFTALDAGSSALALSALANWEFLGPDQWTVLNVDYTGATAQVSEVPVPAAVWLLGSGLSMLGLALRRRA
jgi:hypothetical protein